MPVSTKNQRHHFPVIPAFCLDRRAVEHIAAIDIHGLGHAAVHVGIGGKLGGRVNIYMKFACFLEMPIYSLSMTTIAESTKCLSSY
jgi:hypothetical protein